MPTTLRAEIQSSLSRWVLKGRLISWDQCCIPTQAGGFALPLRDPFNLNIASLLCRRESPPAGGNSRSMLISAHLAMGKAAFLTRCQIDPPSDAPLRDILTLLLKHYKPCYATLAQKYVKNRIDPSTASTWTNNIQENAALLPHHTPRFLRSHLLRVIFNSIPTRQRLRHLGPFPNLRDGRGHSRTSARPMPRHPLGDHSRFRRPPRHSRRLRGPSPIGLLSPSAPGPTAGVPHHCALSCSVGGCPLM